MRILFLSAWFPYPPINGAKLRIYNLIKSLSTKHEITLISLARTINVMEATAHIPHLEQYCRSVDVVAAKSFLPNSLKARVAFLSPIPRSIVQTYNEEMENLIVTKLNSSSYDMVIASEVSAPSGVSLLACKVNGIPKVLDAIEVGLTKDGHFEQVSFWGRVRNGLTLLKLQRFTRQLVLKADACTVPSLQEKKNILEIVPEHPLVEVVPHCLDLTSFKGDFGLPRPHTLVFTGSLTYHANLDGVCYFMHEVYPLIKVGQQTLRLQIIGSTKGVAPEKLESDKNIEFIGLVEDVRPFVAQSWLSIVPLRIGAGTRLKIIESMALGTPVVSTSKGAEGLDVSNRENILIADHPRDFANAVLEVIQDPKLRKKLSINGKRLVKSKYNSEIMGRKFLSLMDQVLFSG